MTRSNYWSCSKFANWLRGTVKPRAATSANWSTWKRQARKDHPLRFWLAEEGLDAIQNTLWWPIDRIYDVKYYINNRWVSKTHYLSTGLKAGKWHEMDERLLHGMFNELVNFVEIELAWWHIAWNGEDASKYKAPFWSRGWFRWRTWRCKQAGLDNLDWQRSITYDEKYGTEPADENFGKPTPQAIAAQEILDLYHWWTVARPARKDPYDDSGWSAICKKRRQTDPDDFFGEAKTLEEKEQTDNALDALRKMEEQFEKEDTEMMIRLIKVRRSLWT